MSDPTQLLGPLLETMDRLAAILEAENQALAAHRPDMVAQSVDQKITLGRTFERQMQQIGSLKAVLDTLPPDKRRRVIAGIQRFGSIATANQTAIAAAQRAAERIVTHIVEAVRKQNDAQPKPYSRPTLARSRNTTNRISVSLNQTL
jgi:hypothetical protein